MKDFEFTEDTVEWLGVAYRTVLQPGASGGAMSIVDSLSPVGSGPPRHIHEAEDETFVILTGQVRVWMAGEEKVLGAGESVFVPRGTDHTFKVIGDMPCRHLIILTPGGFEGFFREMADNDFAIPADMEQITATAARYNLAFTGPPLD